MADHSIVYVELPAGDAREAGRFYAQLFGWDTPYYEEQNYVSINPPSGPGGGFNSLRAEGEGGLPIKPGDVLIYISTPDIEATLDKVESLGGKAVQRSTEIPDVGHFAIFEDPTGNRIGLVKYNAPAQ